MKAPIAIAACAAAFLLAGCESDDLSKGLHSVLAPREAPRTQVFQAEEKATFEAARAAALAMGYRITRSGSAEGTINALSTISGTETDPAGGSSQISMKVRLGPAAGPGTSVTVSFTEILEQKSASEPGMATETPVHDSGLYDAYFGKIQEALQGAPNGQGNPSR